MPEMISIHTAMQTEMEGEKSCVTERERESSWREIKMDRLTGSKVASWDRGKDFKEYLSQKGNFCLHLLRLMLLQTLMTLFLSVNTKEDCGCSFPFH